MKKIFNFTKKKKHQFGTPDNGSVLSAGYDLKEKDLGKVHKAAFNGDLAKLKQLAKKNDINQLDKENRTALHIACASGHVEVVQFLVESKAKLNLCDNQNRSALMKAVQGQHERCVKILLENHAGPNLVDINGNTALHLAANIPSISMAVVLLQYEANINAQNKEGFTPLTVAVREDHIEMAEFLLKESADANHVDQEQRSPLMLAAGNGQISMVKLLLQFNADVTLKDSKGLPAEEYALMNGHHPCSLLITEHSTKRTSGASASHQGPSKKKKVLGNPSQDVEVGLSLGEPATDKNDVEDNSFSESADRVSKSAGDEWPSSDEEESLLNEKKPSNEFLNRIFGSKKGEASTLPDTSLSDSENEPDIETRIQRTSSTPKALTSSNALQPSVDSPPGSLPPKAPQMTSTPLPNYKKGEGKHSEKHSASDKSNNSQEGSSAGEEEEEIGEEEEEEEEIGEEEEDEEEDDNDDDDEEEDEEDDEEEEDEDDGDEGEENEEESVEEDDASSTAAVQADTEDLKPSITDVPKISDGADTQNTPVTDVSLNGGIPHGAECEAGDAAELNAKAEAENADLTCPAVITAYAMPVTLDIAEDCVVSAIRVESKFSDEEESLAKDCLRSSGQKMTSSQGSTEVPTPFRQPPSGVKESQRATEKDHDDSWSDDENRGEGVWNDSDNEDSKKAAGCNVLFTYPKKLLAKVDRDDTDCMSDEDEVAVSNKKGFKGKNRRSSWGSSLEGSDMDIPTETEVNNELREQKADIQAEDLKPEATSQHSKTTLFSNKEQPGISVDSLTSCPEPQSKPNVVNVEESKWDSSEDDDRDDVGSRSKCEVVSPDLKGNIFTENTTREQHKGSWGEDSKGSIEKESNDPSPVVSTLPEDDDGAESVAPLSQKEGRSDSENEKEDSNWDDEDESDDSEKQNRKETPVLSKTSLSSLKSRPMVELEKEATEKGDADDAESEDDGDVINENCENTEETKSNEDQLAADQGSKDDESSDDSDSKHQKLQYDFTSATVKLLDARDDSGNTADIRPCVGGKSPADGDHDARLTSYVPLVAKTREAYDHLNKGQIRKSSFSSPPTKDDDTFSDDALPQTDIDDVDVHSPDEDENTGVRLPELRDTEEPGVQKEESTEDEDYSDGEQDRTEEEEGGDASDENKQIEGGEESPVATSPVPETEVFKDKKRDFLSELGLEEGEDEQDSWDCESNSEHENKPHEDDQDLNIQKKEEMSSTEGPLKENGNISKDENEGESVDKDDAPQKERAKWEPLSVIKKLKGNSEQQKDLMEELGLNDADDLEDASDWDSASTTSKRTLPGRRMASPGLEELPEDFKLSHNEQGGDAVPAETSTPPTSSSSDRKLPSTPSKSAPQPQPRARKMLHQKPDCGEDSDWEADKVTSPYKPSPEDNQMQSIAEPPAVMEPGSPEFLLKAEDTNGSSVFDKQQQKEKDDAVGRRGLDLSVSDHGSSDAGEKDDFRAEFSPEGRAGEDAPWEKRYEKLWVEVEKKEAKSTFKSVASELKEKFGELFKSRPAGNISEEITASTSAEEESSDEEEEVIVRPLARARSTVLVTIPEQRESGQEDSAADSPNDSLWEERMQNSEQRAQDSSVQQEVDLLNTDVLESVSPQLNTTRQKNIEKINTKAFMNDDGTSMGAVDQNSFFKDQPKRDVSADWNNTSSEDEFEETPRSQLPSQNRQPPVSDEELEEDRKSFKPEVEKDIFLSSERKKIQLKNEVGKETENTAMKNQKSSSSLDSGGTGVKDVGSKKPETGLGCVLSHPGGIHQEQQPVAAQSTNRVPVHLHLPDQQSCNSKKQEKPSVGEPSQLEVVRGARPGRAPQTSTHVNGDPLSVFDDSSLSDVSDDEQRLTAAGQQKSKNPEEMDMAEDFDELTQSSDSATDDINSPTSGYGHASLLIQKLDSATFDSTSITKLQNILHEYEHSNHKLRSRHGYLSHKVNQLQVEREELKNSLEEVKDVKSVLEHNQLELQTEITNFKFQLKQEQENRHNANMMYNTTRDKLRRMEEQHQLEVQERQKVELTLRNLELEMRTLISNMKQLEEVHSETQRLLAQERSARALQESLLNNHLRKQQEMEVESRRSMSRSNEALSQLTEASERERDLLQQTAALQEQLTMLRTDLERSQANSSLKERHLLEENEVLKEQLEDIRRDLKLSNETVTQTVFSCNNQLSTLKSELAITTSRLETERQTRETLESELESTRSRLVGAVKETELRLAAHSDSEKALLREKEEHQRLKERLTGEVVNQREAASSLSQKLAKAEARSNSMENEVHRVTLQLTEKGLLLEVLQREKDQAATRVKELETALQAERELVSRAGARQETTQERLAQAQSEAMLLRQHLEEAQNKGIAKERAVTDAQERFSDILSKLRSDCEERVQLVEERNKELAGKAADLRDQIYKLEEEKNERETNLRQLQQELADSLKKLSMSEASLEVNTRYRSDLEEEKARLLRDSDRLKRKLEESEDQYVQAERHINLLKSSLDEKEKELGSAAQKLQEALSASATSEITIKQLEEAVQKLEIENARLEAAAKQQSNRIDSLQKGAHEAAMVRGHLEELVTNLQSSKMTLEEQLSREAQKQSLLSHTAQDSQALWEEELKSRSKLGLRLAELEKEKGELTTQMEIEKKKAKKISEQKKAIDTRLDQEMKRNADLQKEMYRLRTLLKTAKKKLRDQEAGGAEFGSPVSSLRMDRHSQAEGAFGRMKDKVDDLQVQLEKETHHRSQLEKANEELKVQIASIRSSSHNSDHLERSKRQLEEEVLDLRRRMETSQVEQSQVEQYRREAEGKARQEIQQKLEQVNLFLQSQAASQEALDQIKAANEASLRSQLEQKIRELEGELGRARTTQQDSLNQRDSTRSELERYRQLYTEEMLLRKSQAAKLERANSRLAEANSKLLNERSRSLITSNITNGSLVGPSLDLSSLGSPANYGAALGSLNRNLGLGLSILNPATEGQNSRVEDYLAKMRSELDRNISRELSNATAELDAASVRMSLVGSASRAELDPLSLAAQEYLEVLKKNNRI